jgi:hypothetical protein
MRGGEIDRERGVGGRGGGGEAELDRQTLPVRPLLTLFICIADCTSNAPSDRRTEVTKDAQRSRAHEASPPPTGLRPANPLGRMAMLETVGLDGNF